MLTSAPTSFPTFNGAIEHFNAHATVDEGFKGKSAKDVKAYLVKALKRLNHAYKLARARPVKSKHLKQQMRKILDRRYQLEDLLESLGDASGEEPAAQRGQP